MPEITVIEGGKGNEIENVRDAYRRLQAARHDYATEFLLRRSIPDRQGVKLAIEEAKQQSIAATGDEITAAEAELQIALHLMRSGYVAHEPGTSST